MSNDAGVPGAHSVAVASPDEPHGAVTRLTVSDADFGLMQLATRWALNHCIVPQHLRARAERVAAMLGMAATLMLAAPSQAAPPPVGSEDYELTAPYGDWFRSLHNAEGALCCTLADCRPVQARVSTEGHWEFFADPRHFPNAEGLWVRVPDDRVLRRPNPVGQPVACYIPGFAPFCFLPADAV